MNANDLEPSVDILRAATQIDRRNGLEQSARNHERAAKILELYAEFSEPDLSGVALAEPDERAPASH